MTSDITRLEQQYADAQAATQAARRGLRGARENRARYGGAAYKGAFHRAYDEAELRLTKALDAEANALAELNQARSRESHR